MWPVLKSIENWAWRQDTTTDFGPHTLQTVINPFVHEKSNNNNNDNRKIQFARDTSIYHFFCLLSVSLCSTKIKSCLRECESNRTIVSVELLQIGKKWAVECKGKERSKMNEQEINRPNSEAMIIARPMWLTRVEYFWHMQNNEVIFVVFTVWLVNSRYRCWCVDFALHDGIPL